MFRLLNLELQKLSKDTGVPITDEDLQIKYLTTEMTSPKRVYTENA